jgi:hypothetical protein
MMLNDNDIQVMVDRLQSKQDKVDDVV